MLLAADFRSLARKALSGKWGLAIITCLVAGLLGGLGSFAPSDFGLEYRFDYNDNFRWALDWVNRYGVFLFSYALAMFLFGGAINVGYSMFNIRLVSGETPAFSDIFAYMDKFLKLLGLRIVVSIKIALWSLLFVIPGIIAAFRYSMASYIMADNPEMGIFEAIDESGRMMMGNKGRLFCLGISFIGWNLLGVLTAGIGMLWVTPYAQAATAAFYQEISGKNGSIAR